MGTVKKIMGNMMRLTVIKVNDKLGHLTGTWLMTYFAI